MNEATRRRNHFDFGIVMKVSTNETKRGRRHFDFGIVMDVSGGEAERGRNHFDFAVVMKANMNRPEALAEIFYEFLYLNFYEFPCEFPKLPWWISICISIRSFLRNVGPTNALYLRDKADGTFTWTST